MSLEQCTTSQLLHLLRCKKRNAIYDIIDEETANELTLNLQKAHPPRSKKFKITQAIAAPLTDVSDYPLIVLWSVIGVISLGVLPLIVGTSILAIMSLTIGGLFCYSNYNEIQKKEQELNKLLYLYALKRQAADIILKRHHLNIEVSEKPSYTNKNLLPLIKESVSTAMLISTPLCSAYFLALNVVLTTFHLTLIAGFMTGPFGLMLGLLPAMLIGICFGYIHYLAAKQDDLHQFEEKCERVIVNKKIELCELLNLQDQPHLPLAAANRPPSKCKYKFTVNFFPDVENTPVLEEDVPLPQVIGF